MMDAVAATRAAAVRHLRRLAPELPAALVVAACHKIARSSLAMFQQHTTREPAWATSGRSAPNVVVRVLQPLCAAGARRLRRPRCAACGRELRARTVPDGTAYRCTGCARARGARLPVVARAPRPARCGRCGRTAMLARRRPPLCQRCYYGVRRCRACGRREAHNGTGRRCARCVAREWLARLCGSDARYRALVATLLARPSAVGLLGALRGRFGTVLAAFVAAGGADHATLERCATGRSVATIRALLVATGVLPARDETLAAFARWRTEAAVGATLTPAHRALLTRFADGIADGLRGKPWSALHYARVLVRAGAHVLTALEERHLRLRQCTLVDLGHLARAAPRIVHRALQFLRWARAQGALRFALPPNGGASAYEQCAPADWNAAVERLMHDEAVPLPIRIAVLCVLFGVPATRVVCLPQDALTLDGAGLAWLQVGRAPYPLLDLGPLVAAFLASDRRLWRNGDALPSPWLFPGRLAGQHLAADTLLKWLQRLGIRSRAFRQSYTHGVVRAGLDRGALADCVGLARRTPLLWGDADHERPDLLHPYAGLPYGETARGPRSHWR